MATIDPHREKGLPSIRAAREARAAGRGRYTTGIGVAALVVLLVGYVGYRRSQTEDLGKRRHALEADVAVLQEKVGTPWEAFAKQVEVHAAKLAAPDYEGDLLSPSAYTWNFRASKAVYLRVPMRAARSPESLRAALVDPVKDGFVSCMFRYEAPPPSADGGALADLPWLMGKGYTSVRVLSAKWKGDALAAPDDLRLRVFEQQLTSAAVGDLELARAMATETVSVVMVLDEFPEDELAPTGDAGETHASLMARVHPSRVLLLDRASNRIMARVRRRGEGKLYQVGDPGLADSGVAAATNRQVHGCNLARQTLAALTPALPPVSPSAKPSGPTNDRR